MRLSLALAAALAMACGPSPAPDERPGDEGVALWDEFWDPDAVVVPEREPCSDAKLAAVRGEGSQAVVVDCHLNLNHEDRISRRLVLHGEASSGVRVDCNGAEIGSGTASGNEDSIRIRSDDTDGGWVPVHDVEIRDCRVLGSIRIWGRATNGEGSRLLETSRTMEHVLETRRAAPYNINLIGLHIRGVGRIPLYLSPGVHHVSIRDSEITGHSDSVMVYLDAESTDNRIVSTDIDARGNWKRAMAWDGSSNNELVDSLVRSDLYGLELYRNCGQGGVARHATSSGNRIRGTRFDATGICVWFGARGGDRSYCGDDEPGEYGSAVSDFDWARNNTGSGNSFHGCVVHTGDTTNSGNDIGG